MDNFKFFTKDYTEKIKGISFVEHDATPWSPFTKDLIDSNLVLVTTAGVHAKKAETL